MKTDTIALTFTAVLEISRMRVLKNRIDARNYIVHAAALNLLSISRYQLTSSPLFGYSGSMGLNDIGSDSV